MGMFVKLRVSKLYKCMNSHIKTLCCDRRCSLMVTVDCESKCSNKCRVRWKLRYSRAIDSIENNGKIICLYCSRTSKNSGRGNPNCKYKSLDDNFFNHIDTEEKAYLLGFIAGDGTVQPENQIEVVIHERDLQHLELMKNLVCSEIPIFKKDEEFFGFRLCSKKITQDVCKWLNINPGDKSRIVQMPLFDENLTWHFIRGLFDADGHIVKKFVYNSSPSCNIASISNPMKLALNDVFGGRIDETRIVWHGDGCMKFLSRMYKNSSIFLGRKKQNMTMWEEFYESKRSNKCCETG